MTCTTDAGRKQGGRTGVPALHILRPLLSIVAADLVSTGDASPVRAIAVGLFVLAVPGWALLDVRGLAQGWLGAGLVVATSTALATAVVLLMLYANQWSPEVALFVLVVFTLCTDLPQVVRYLRNQERDAR
jgi:hypothetical protein